MTDIDQLEQLHEAATPGPWFQDPDEPRWVHCDERFLFGPGEQSDAKLLVTLRNAAPALIAEIRRLRAIEEAAREFDEAYAEPWDRIQKLKAALAAKGEA